MVKIRLRRMGSKKNPFYRIVVADSRYPRNGRFIEEIGTYDPLQEPAAIKVDAERAQAWIKTGAQPTETVKALLKKANLFSCPGVPTTQRPAAHSLVEVDDGLPGGVLHQLLQGLLVGGAGDVPVGDHPGDEEGGHHIERGGPPLGLGAGKKVGDRRRIPLALAEGGTVGGLQVDVVGVEHCIEGDGVEVAGDGQLIGPHRGLQIPVFGGQDAVGQHHVGPLLGQESGGGVVGNHGAGDVLPGQLVGQQGPGGEGGAAFAPAVPASSPGGRCPGPRWGRRSGSRPGRSG